MSRRRQPARRSSKARRRGVTGPSPAQLAAGMIDAVAADLADTDPLQAQLVASYLVADRLEQYWDDLAAAQEADPSSTGDEVPRPALALVRLVGEVRDQALREPALALALAFASLDPEDEQVQDAAAAVVGKLRFLGAKVPPWAEQVLDPELLGTWCLRDVFGDTMTVYVASRHAGDAPPHCVAARIEQSDIAELVDVFVTEGPDVVVPEIERTLAEDGDAWMLRLDELAPAAAGQLLWDVIAGVEESGGDALDDDSLDAFAMLESRAALLGPAMDAASDDERAYAPHASELDELDAAALGQRFLASDAYAATDGVHEELALVIAEWATSLLATVARFSPNLALDLLADLAEAAEGDAERDLLVAHGIPTVRAWARLCAQYADLPDRALETIEQVLDEAAGDYERLVREGPEAPRA